MDDDLLLPPGVRLVHIGPPKTGTTAVQHAFDTVRDELGAHGVRYAPHDESRPRAAVSELLRATAPGPAGAWHGLAAQIAEAGDLRVCVSNEMLARCDAERAGRVVADLGGERVHVVMTARPLDRLLPSQWQQRVRKQARMASYDDWLRIVLSDDPGDAGHPFHRHFWGLHDLAAQIERWTAASDPTRVVVAVSDEADRGFLPRLFESLLGLPEGLLVPPSTRSNRSLDHSEAELMRALDETAHEAGWDRRLYLDEVKPAMSKYLRQQPRGQGDPILLPAWARARVAELDEQRIALLARASVTVIGDAERLRVDPADDRPPGPLDRADGRVPVATAVRFTEAAVETMRRREQALRRRARRAERAPQAPTIDRAAGRDLARALLARAGRRLRR